MKFIDEFRNADHVRALRRRLAETAERLAAPVRLMEICGGHTHAVHRFGLPGLLPHNVELISGPGCPVCVTPTTFVDRAIEIAHCRDTTVATFGDLYRVPGRETTLEAVAGRRADVRVVYSPRDALAVAAENPDRPVVFLGVGFETTAPTVAATVIEAAERGIMNFRVLSGHKTMPAALRALLDAPEVAVDGFLLPGHVSTITGDAAFEFLPAEYGAACSVTGFEPTDILRSVLALIEQCVEGCPRVDNRYARAVRHEGNRQARAVVERVFEPADAQWRGIGLIPASGLDLREEWAAFREDAPSPDEPSVGAGACRCGEVLRGLLKPPECPLFGKACKPESPLGPCMVSSEGSCAAYYKYGPSRPS